LGQLIDRGGIKGLKVVPILPAIFLCLAFLLKILYSLPIRDSFLWYAGVFFCFYIPGNLLVRYIGFNKDEYFVNFFHSVALGAALMPLFYTIMRWLSRPELLYVFIIFMFLFWFIPNIREFKEKKGNIYTSPKDLISILVLIGTIFILLHLSHFTDVIFLENGFKIRNVYLTETIFHLGIINILKDTFPPIFPYASGYNFYHYHLNMHLEIEMFNRFFSIDTLKLTFLYFPLLYFCLLVFVPYIFIRKNGGSGLLGVIAGILMFGSDLSFIPGLLGIIPLDYPWTLIFTTTIWSLLTLNGYLSALFVMFLCVLYLKKFFENGNSLYLLVFAFLGYSAYGFKSSMGHIMGVAFLTGIASVVLMKDKKKGMLLCVVSALTILLIALDIILFRGGTGNNILYIDLFNHFRDSLKYFGITDRSWFLYLLIFPIYTLATFGVRIFGFYALKDAFDKEHFNPVFVFLTIFVISGFLLSDMIFLGSGVHSSFRINNAIWFSVQSLMGGWLLLSYFLLKIRHDRKRFLGIIALIILFSAPSTVQFFTLRFDHNYYTVNSDAVEVTKYLDTTPPGSIVLHPLNYNGPSLASNLACRPSVLNLFRSFVTQNIEQIEVENRLKDVMLFFSRNKVINRSSIFRKYKVDYVYAPLSYVDILDTEPMLSQVLKNREYVIYRVKSNYSL